MVDLPSSDLQQPLGAPRPSAPASPWPKRLSLGFAGGSAALLAAAFGYVAFFGKPELAQPGAVAEIREVPARPERSAELFGRPTAESLAGSPAERTESTATQLEQESGVRVMRPGGTDTPGSVVIRVPEPESLRLAPAPDRRLIERTRHGNLPRIGEDGARAWQVYARPVPPQAAAAPVRVAILIGGLGISATATADAIARLPGEVSFAFAPYGGDLERQVQRARADGHEVFLQVPMEPFDYPDNDPGPHTLTTGPSAGENTERLRWLLARFPGYVGIVNFMGARFMADEAALAPALREVAERGLLVVDDGSSGRSVMSNLAAGYRTPALRADLVLDLVMRGDAIDRELARLEQIARSKGFALASASALPVSIERIGRWARAAEQRGIRLVPVTAIANPRTQTTGSLR